MQVTKNGGFAAYESPDGKFLYVWSRDGTIKMIRLSDGQETRILDGVPEFHHWSLLDKGICFLGAGVGPTPLKFFDFASRRTKVIGTLDLGITEAPGSGSFSALPDGKVIFYTRVDAYESDIMLIENFR